MSCGTTRRSRSRGGTWGECLPSRRVSRGRFRAHRSDCLGDHTDALLVTSLVLELDAPRDRREEGVVASEVRSGTGEERHPTLAHDDRPGRYELAVAGLHAEPLANAVATVLRARSRLLVCHVYSSFWVPPGGDVSVSSLVAGSSVVSMAISSPVAATAS